MTTVPILWSATVKNALEPFAANCECLAAPWADSEASGETAVQHVIESWMRAPEWQEWIGNDASKASILVTIHAPASIAGEYSVALDRVVRARARRNDR